MSYVALGTTAVSVVGGLLTKKSSSTPKYTPLDINKVITDARTNAATNYGNSIGLEKQYNPLQAQNRELSQLGIRDLLSGNTTGLKARDSLLSTVGNPILDSNPLLKASTNRIMANLNLGGQLDPETQAATVRAGLSGAGSSGLINGSAGRGLVARDLGLTSLGLQNQREQAAQAAGSQLGQLQLADYQARAGFASTAASQDAQSRLGIQGLLQNAALPQSGLSPDAIASLYVSDNNAKNQVAVNSSQINNANNQSAINSAVGIGSLFKSSGGASAVAGLFSGSGGTTTGGGSIVGLPNGGAET